MKVKKTTLEQLMNMYTHPSAYLFRSIELKTIYEKTKNEVFKQPSLDLGSGDGKIAKILFDGQFTYGVDNGEANDYKESIKHKIYKKVLLESAEHMSLPKNSVNFIFSNSVIEHIPDNEAVLSEVSRILKQGGKFVFTSPSDQFRKNLFVSMVFNQMKLGFLSSLYSVKRNQMLNHYHLYSYATWKKKLRKYNLFITKHAYYIPRETLLLWDKMALQCIATKIITKKAETLVAKKYKEEIEKYYYQSKLSPTYGSSIFIECIKK